MTQPSAKVLQDLMERSHSVTPKAPCSCDLQWPLVIASVVLIDTLAAMWCLYQWPAEQQFELKYRRVLAVRNTLCRLPSGDAALPKSSSSPSTLLACRRWTPCRPMWIQLPAPVVASRQPLHPILHRRFPKREWNTSEIALTPLSFPWGRSSNSLGCYSLYV